MSTIESHVRLDPAVSTAAGLGVSLSVKPTPNGQNSGLALPIPSTLSNMGANVNSHETKSIIDLDEESDEKAAAFALERSTKPSGLCYDARMRFHTNPDPSDPHPERPDRITSIYNELRNAGLTARHGTDTGDSTTLLKRIPAYPAERSEVLLVHTEQHYRFVKSTHDMSQDDLIDRTLRGDSIYFHKTSFICAKLSVGGAINCCRAVMNGEVKNAIAVIRPPGHHAETEEPQGFCLFDNVAIAARVCQQEFKLACRKILILDWDVHHGNGIQKSFYDDPNILYISLHRWTASPRGDHFYPGESGSPKLCGHGPGLGKNVNIPFSEMHMHDVDYLYAFQEIVMPIAMEFDPDFVIVAAGFDAADGDDLGSYHVSPPGYAHMTHMLSSLANGKMVVCLEGGYNLHSISTSALAVTRVLMGEPPDRLQLGTLSQSAKADIANVKSIQSEYWQCMSAPRNVDEEWLAEVQADRLQDVIREWQGSRLYREHRFINLAIFRDQISITFDKQVFASRDYHNCRKLLVIFHDPPDIVGRPNPITLEIESHQAWIADITKAYVKQAVEQGYGIIDVNIPKAYTGLTSSSSTTHIDPSATQATTTSSPPFHPPALRPSALSDSLAVYLWENYIEPNERASISLLGVGDAYHSLVHLVNSRSEDITERVSAVVGFAAVNKLVSVSTDVDASLAAWYHASSRIYTAADHPAFDPARRPPKRKFGRLLRSGETTLSKMMHAHQQDVFEWLAKRVEVDEEMADGVQAASTLKVPK